MKKILIADKDESLKDAFRVVFPSDEYEILFTSNGREVEKIVEEYRPEIYILNTSLDRRNGTDVYEDLKEKNMLQNVRFFFMKDEGIESDLSGYQIEGVIEKPINFFRVHQMIDKEDVLPELKITKKIEDNEIQRTQSYSALPKERMTVLENELKKIIYDSIESIKMSIVDKITPIISQYIEEYTKKILNDAAEKVIRNEMDKLLSLIRESRK
ncbi:MAG: response regulator [Proteobacteria bacterium]|nr:response regulator [Pseudomonadota bacterium]